MEGFRRDVSYALRGFRRNPGFAAVSVMVLAIGIGTNAAMFSVLHGVVLRPLDFPEPDLLVGLGRRNADGSGSGWVSRRRLESMQGAQSFTGVGAFLAAGDQVALSGGGHEPEMLRGARVSANFLEILGVEPVAGRGFLAEEGLPGAPPVALISAELWNRRFGGDPAVVGRFVTLDAQPHTIVGVLAAQFRFPDSGLDVWRTQPWNSKTVPAQYQACCTPLTAFARLRPGVSDERARAELDVLADRYGQANPGARNLDAGPLVLTRWKDRLTARVDRMLWMLVAAVAAVLLIACANVATLSMTRAAHRAREFAVRWAVGASRRRLARQLLTESLLLGAAGCLVGLALAWIAIDAIGRMTLVELPRAEEIGLNGITLAFGGILSIATSVMVGSLPAFQSVRPDLANSLHHSGVDASASGGRRSARITRRTLVAAQVALSLVLLVAAGLMAKSLVRLAGVEPGFNPSGLLTFRVTLPQAPYDTAAKRTAFFDELTRQVEAVPGVRSVATVRSLPTTGGLGTNIQIVGEEIAEPGHIGMMLQTISPGALQVLGIPLRRGREFVPRDNVAGAPPVAVINEAFARRLWSGYPEGVDPVGRGLRVPVLERGPLEIVGVVGDVRHSGPAGEASPQFYIPSVLYPPQTAFVAIRSRDASAMVGALRAAVQTVDPEQPIQDVRMMEDMLQASIGQQHVAGRLLGLFAGVALLLAVVGLYGLVAASVVQRTQEIGIRRAFGARHGDILRSVVRDTLVMTSVGVGVGLAAAAAFARLLTSFLFGISPFDAATFVAVAALFVMVAAIASIIPAWRAVRIDPMTALRV